MNRRLLFTLSVALLLGGWLASFARADALNFFTPVSWNVGDANSTYQEWNEFSSSTGNTPDVGLTVNPSISSSPTLGVNAPGFLTGSFNFYSFGGNYSAQADIFNHGGTSGSGSYASNFGTHIVVQTAATMNPDPEAGGPASVFLGSLQIVEHDGDPITGGTNGDALQETEIWTGIVSSSFGDVTQQELIWEFWLPSYTDDFRVEWDEIIHSSFDQLRIDSLIVEAANDGGTPLGLILVGGHVWNTPAVSELWGTAGNWLEPGVPASDWIATVENVQAYDQTAVVTANSTVDRITVSGQTNTMSVHVQSGVDLTSTTNVVVDSLGVARVDGTLATTTFDVNSGGGVRAEVSTPSVNHIAADEAVTIASGATLTIDQGATPGAGAHLFHILKADADSAGGELVSGTFDTVSLPGDDGLGRRYSVLYENHAANGVGAVDTVKVGLARSGDADFNSLVDALDLLAASPFFGTTTPANWRQGNWNDTGGSQGIVDAIDLLDASPFFSQTYGGGDLLLGGDDTTPGQTNDGQPSICYDYTTGEVTIDTDDNTTNTYVLDSLSGIFTGLAPNFIGGTFFTTDTDFRIAENFHTNLNGVHNLGAVAQTGLSLGFLLNDLTLQGGSAGNPNFEFDLVVKNTPEPSTIVLIGLGLLGGVVAARRRRRA